MPTIKAVVAVAVAVVLAGTALAETHTISFNNKCGFGTPTLIQGGRVLSTGEPYTANGQFNSFIAYLQTGNCGFNGERCTLVEGTLQNTGFSSADISLIAPHSFSVTSGFGYYGVCDGIGLDCTSANCPGAFTNPTNGNVVVCTSDNSNLAITFCN